MSNAGQQDPVSRIGLFFLLGAIFAAAACAIVYELLIGSVSAYFLGDSVKQFSLTIGFFLAAMGLGAWFSRFARSGLLVWFIALELALGLIGGISVGLLYTAYLHSHHYQYWMLSLIISIGSLIGLELPILTRILEEYGSLRTILANVLSMDYLGALVASLIFPYLLLPVLGSLNTGLVAGGVNVVVGVAVMVCFWGNLSALSRRWLSIQVVVIVVVLGGIASWGDVLLGRWENGLYTDRIIHTEESPYQKIVLTQWQNDIRLFLDGHLQFASVDEHRYHESLVHPAMSLAAHKGRVLIVGGGDGLTAREVLKYRQVEKVDLVDLDAAVTRLGKRHFQLTRLNKNSLSNQKLTVHNEDAFQYIQRPQEPYNIIIVDLPDPREEALSKLYSVEGYRLFRRHLAPGGVLVTQASSPYFAPQTFWSIAATLEAADMAVVSYHLNVPSFGEWGFHLASVDSIKLDGIRFTVPRRYLREEIFEAMQVFDPDMAPRASSVNHLDQPELVRLYRQEWGRW